MRIDFAPELGKLNSSAGITGHDSPQALVGRQLVAVVKVPPKPIGPRRSQCPVTGFHDDRGAVVSCTPDRELAPDSRLR